VGNICLTDFGLSKESVSTPTAARTFCGTPEYLAPEILQGVGHGKAVDWWSLGTLIFEMLTGLPPFYSRNVNHMYEKILKARRAAATPPALPKPPPPRALGAGGAALPVLLASRREGTHRTPPRARPAAATWQRGRRHQGVPARWARRPAQWLTLAPWQELEAKGFFQPLDFEKVYRKEYTPIFKPNLSSNTDTTQFDPQFTAEEAVDSHVDTSVLGSQPNQFDGFTFQDDTPLGK